MKKNLWKRCAAFSLALVMTVIPDQAAFAKGLTVPNGEEQTVENIGSDPLSDEPIEASDKSVKSSDKSVLKALNFDVPLDSEYKQDALYTGTRSVGTMSELILSRGGIGQTNVYDYDNNENIRNIVSGMGSVNHNYAYGITETLDGSGDGKKDLLVDLYLENTRTGGRILMSLTQLVKNEDGTLDTKEIFTAKETGGHIVTTSDISSWEVEGLLSMCAGDFDGDGREELAVYTPNNKEETPSGSTSDTLQIRIFKLSADSAEPGQPYQTIDIALVGSNREDCQEWLYSHAGSRKTYYSIPYMQLTAGDVSKDGIDDLLTVANFSSTFRGRWLGTTMTWKQVLNPNSAFASVLDVYQGKRDGNLEQVVKKRVLVAKDSDKSCALRNASVTVANVTGANTNEIVIGGNYTGFYDYNDSATENTTVTKNCCVWVDKSDDPKVAIGYVSAAALLSEADTNLAAALSYNWTIHEDGYEPLHYYNGDKDGKYKTGKDGSSSGDYDAACEPVTLDGFAAYGCDQPDTVAMEAQLFELSDENGKLSCNAYAAPSNIGSKKSNVWISSQTVGNVTNDAFGRETLYFTNGKKRSGEEQYWNDVISVWGEVNANGKKEYKGSCISDGKSAGSMHYSLSMCDIDTDSSYIQYEAGNTDVYYSDVQVLTVLQAPPVYDDLGDDYVSDAETTYEKSTGSSTGEGQSVQVSAGVVFGFENEVSILGMKAFSMELEAELSASVGWDSEKTAEQSFTTSYTASGTNDSAVIYTVPYVRYNAKIYVPTYKMPKEDEFYAKQSFLDELEKHLIRYKEVAAGVTGGKYANPNDGYNDGFTTDVTAENYEYQQKTYYKYMEWLDQTQAQISKECNPGMDQLFHFSGTHTWGEEIEGGWEDYFYSIPQTPIITSVSADTYEKIAKNCSNLQSLYGTALPSGYRAGDPETYADSGTLSQRTKAVKDSIVNGKMTFGSEEAGTQGDGFVNVTPMSSANTSVTQSIEFNEENAKTQTVGVGFSISQTVGAGNFKAGLSFSTDYEASYSRSTTNGCCFEGSVPNLPQRPSYMSEDSYNHYSYNWKLVAYDAMVNGSKVPVVGYFTKKKGGEMPPSTALYVELENVTSDSISFMWSGGMRPADHYNIYQVIGSKDAKQYEKIGTAASAGEDGMYHFTQNGLQPQQTYTYVVGACNENETAVSIYSDEIEANTPIPEFDVEVGLKGVDSSETYLAGTNLTMTAELMTENYKDSSEADDFIWQVNDGNGWKKISDAAGQETYTWKALAEMDGYQYRCGAYVVVNNQLYRLYSEPMTLHVRKADVKVTLKADKSEGAADKSSEFGLAAYTNGDVLELTAQVEAEEGSQPTGTLVFVAADTMNTANVRKYPAEVSEDGVATVKCTFARVGRYTITANYEENERVHAAISENSVPYYAYDISQREDRKQGQNMEETIYEQPWEDITIKNALEKKEEITNISTEYEEFEQKDFVESGAKEKLETTVEILEAAETLETIDSVVDVAIEHIDDKKEDIEKAKEAYEKLNEKQKELLKEEKPVEKLKAAEDKIIVSDMIKKINALGTVTADNAAQKEAAVKELEKSYAALTDEQKALVPEAVKKILTDAKAVYQTTNKTDSVENPEVTEKEDVRKIAEKLGVSAETAVSIYKLAEEMGIDTELLLLTEEDIFAQTSEKDIKGSKFGTLCAKAAKVTKDSVKLSWKKRKGADGYVVYGAACGKKNAYQTFAEIQKGNAKSCTLKKLKKGSSSRFIVRAYKMIDGKKITISVSKAVHVVTEGGKKGNVKGVKVNKTKAVLKKGKTLKLKASEIKGKKPSKKCRNICYESSNEAIATVTKSGKIKAKAKGKCTIYVYTRNGLYKEVKITVK